MPEAQSSLSAVTANIFDVHPFAWYYKSVEFIVHGDATLTNLFALAGNKISCDRAFFHTGARVVPPVRGLRTANLFKVP